MERILDVVTLRYDAQSLVEIGIHLLFIRSEPPYTYVLDTNPLIFYAHLTVLLNLAPYLFSHWS